MLAAGYNATFTTVTFSTPVPPCPIPLKLPNAIGGARFTSWARAAAALAALIFGLVSSSAYSDSGATATAGPLRIIALPTAPFVLPGSNPPAGFSVDIWNEVARRMHVDFAWRMARDPAELFAAVQNQDAEVAIGAIVITPEREKAMDFSIPFLDSGLRIMVPTDSQRGVVAAIVWSIPWTTVGHLLLAAIVIIVLLANLLWLIQRHRDKGTTLHYLPGVGEGLWRIMRTIAAAAYGDTDAPTVTKRIAVVLVWLLGVAIIAQLTASLTSFQTVERLRLTIRGPGDLPGKTIASVPDTAAAHYLTARELSFIPVHSAPEALRLLQHGEVQAMVFDAPSLEYWAAKEGRNVVEVVGPIFRPEKYAFAVANGSALRKQIDVALLEMYKDGTYERIYSSWFTSR
jgi:ABC-type amino acid transport substrate-binding protein